MNKEQLEELNELLLPKEHYVYPGETVFLGVANPAEAEEFDCIVFKNYGEPMETETFEEELKTFGFIQNKNSDTPNIKLLKNAVIPLKFTVVDSFEFIHKHVQIILAKDQNGPRKGNVGINDFLDEVEL